MNDDDEPITKEWWEAEHINDKLHVIDNCPVSLVIRRGSVELILNIEEGFRLSMLLRAVRTRGDVRQLVRLLGKE